MALGEPWSARPEVHAAHKLILASKAALRGESTLPLRRLYTLLRYGHDPQPVSAPHAPPV